MQMLSKFYFHNGYSYRILAWGTLIFLCGFIKTNIGFCTSSHDLPSILARLDAHIQKQVQNKQLPGCAVAVVYQNKIVFINTYGVKAFNKKEKIDPDTIFQLGSLSKPITATLTSILEHKGLLRLEDPVNYYLPRFSLKSRQPPHTLKVKHILSHSTGVPRAGFNNLIESQAPYPLILRALQNTPVRTAVGKRYDYNNAMYSLISDITHAATRTPFHMALQTNLLQPLNMNRTSASLTGLLKTPNRAIPHIRKKRGWIPCEQYSKGYYTVAPAGGINSSIRDMAIFLKAQLGGYPEVLTQRMLARIQTAQVPTTAALSPAEGPPQLIKNPRYALGWRIVDFAHHKLVFHGGWLKGFTNFIGFMPDQQIGIVVLHNGESRFSSKTAVKFFELYLDIPHQKKKPLTYLKPKNLKLQKIKIQKIKKLVKPIQPIKSLQTQKTHSHPPLARVQSPKKPQNISDAHLPAATPANIGTQSKK